MKKDFSSLKKDFKIPQISDDFNLINLSLQQKLYLNSLLLHNNKTLMDFKDIAAVSGKGGLFKVVKPTKTGVILESLDDSKTKVVTTMNQKVSVLAEISVYSTGDEETIPLNVVFSKIKEEFGDDPGVDKNSDPDELKSFLAHILPDYDRDRVYVSDIKKIINWYMIVYKWAPEMLDQVEETEEDKNKE